MLVVSLSLYWYKVEQCHGSYTQIVSLFDWSGIHVSVDHYDASDTDIWWDSNNESLMDLYIACCILFGISSILTFIVLGINIVLIILLAHDESYFECA